MAIAFDAATHASISFAGTLTFAHTISGSDRILFVQAFGSLFVDDPTGNEVAGAIWNTSEGMTEIARKCENNGANPTVNRWCYLYYLINPTAGTHNVEVVSGGAGIIGGGASSYTGASQTGQPDASATNAGSGTSATDSTTVVAANSWIVATVKENQGWTLTATNGIERAASSADGLHIVDSNGTVSTGANTIGGTGSPSADWAVISASFKPVGAAGGVIIRTYYDQIPQRILNV